MRGVKRAREKKHINDNRINDNKINDKGRAPLKKTTPNIIISNVFKLPEKPWHGVLIPRYCPWKTTHGPWIVCPMCQGFPED